MSQLAMLLPDGAPRASSRGFAVREAVHGDEAGLAQVLAAAFGDRTWSDERVQRELTGAEDVLEVFVAEDEDGIVATASARRFEKFPGLGYVHWVAVAPEKRGQRLGRFVVEAVTEYFSRAGVPGVILETDDERLPAIATYLGLGFVPEYLADDHRPRWSQVFAALGDAQSRKEK